MQQFLIAAISIDGYIGQDKAQASIEWTSKADKKFFVEKTKEAGVMLMGRTTYDTIGRPLPGRLSVVFTRDKKLWTREPKSRDEARSYAWFTSKSFTEVLEVLDKLGFSQAAICGGSKIYTQFLQADLVDKMYISVEPVVFGAGIPLFAEPILRRFELISSSKLGDESCALLEYERGNKMSHR